MKLCIVPLLKWKRVQKEVLCELLKTLFGERLIGQIQEKGTSEFITKLFECWTKTTFPRKLHCGLSPDP